MIFTVIAYVVVVPLVQFCLTGGVWLIGFPVALLLAWAPISFRTTVAGIIGGIAGVVLAVAFGYGVFRLLVGPGSFTLGPFLASTGPLLLPIWNDLVQSKRVKTERQQLLDTLRDSRDTDTVKAMAAETQTAHGSAVVGEVAGLVLAARWFFSQHAVLVGQAVHLGDADWPNPIAANSRRAFRLRDAGHWRPAPALHRRSPAAVAELGR